MTAIDLHTDWLAWHDAREDELRLPHGWLSLTGLHWLDDVPRSYGDLPGRWWVHDGRVALVGACGALGLDGTALDEGVFDPVDGLPGVLVDVGERKIEIIRRTDAFALRVRDPRAVTRTAFAGVPVFPVAQRWIVRGHFVAYPEPRRLVVDAVVDGLHHYPVSSGEVHFELDGTAHVLVAVPFRAGGLTLHFRDATSGVETYGGGRLVRTPDPSPDGEVLLDLNRTINLPCAFTAYATCPLPPAQNRLDLAVTAGERRPPRPDLARPAG
ncbi:DUF1684 domain-containing protein [Pseudonocardia sp.]|uniref:DUF1684 domain-containing protein n=1 Tax=Pseudonocardia sp. TaxID=60912 RepID=UPI003D13DF66